MRFRPLPLLLLLLPLTCLGAWPSLGASATTGDIAGTVTDTGGTKPIPNALVRIQFGPQVGTARTDANGKFRLADLTPGEYQVAVQKPAYNGQLKQDLQVAANTTLTANFKLAFGSLTTGAAEVVVETSGGTRLSGARLDLYSGSFVGRLTTDETGSVVFPGLNSGTYRVQSHRDGYADLTSRNFQVRAGQLVTYRLVLQRDPSQVGELSGTVKDVDGFPVRNATVAIADGLTTRSIKTGGNGQYRLSRLIPDEDYRLQITAGGFATQNVGPVPVRLGQTTFQDFFLIPNTRLKGSLSGTVRDDQSRPLPFAAVQIVSGPVPGQTVQTDGAGRYLFQDLAPASNYGVVATLSGYSPAGVSGLTVNKGSTAVANLVLKNQSVSPGTLRGTVREAGSLATLSGVLVRVIQGESTGLAQLTDGSGLYELTGIIPDQGYTLQFTKDGYNVFSQSLINVAAGVTVTVDANLTPRNVSTGKLSGTVRVAGGDLLTGVKVTLYRGPTSPLSVTTGVDGAFNFNNLAPGTNYAVRAEKSGFITQEITARSVSNGQTTTVNVVLQRRNNAGAIRGRVVNLSQTGLNARVKVLTGPTLPEDVFTDAQGYFTFESLKAGTYSLQVTANGYPTRTQSNVVVTSGSTARPTIVMTP